eukprot:g2238.t1
MEESLPNNVLSVNIRRLLQLRETSVLAIEPYFKISIGDGMEVRRTSLGKKQTEKDEFFWGDNLLFSIPNYQMPTELQMILKRQRVGPNRTIASAIVPLNGVVNGGHFTLNQELKDPEGILRGIVELVISFDRVKSNHRHVSSIESLDSSNGGVCSQVGVGRGEVPTGLTWSSSYSGGSQLTNESDATGTSGTNPVLKEVGDSVKTYGQAPKTSGAPMQRPLPLQKNASSPMPQIQELLQSGEVRRQDSEPMTRYPRIVDDGSIHQEPF